ncbi:putative Eukaryotic membrane protein family protein [Blattamonas nauphoetae]|uniref:Eukaryotic membrane protein family protein n=1 Tax=Blattamonas nauphoetae TaxID=2049346 RepID=A0ABQ9YK40_9EUKA|nr:putative Eukaryotic membrane protein family protein [Blattamonas nauphoetae]
MWESEKTIYLGTYLCFDSVLFYVTTLPIRIVIASVSHIWRRTQQFFYSHFNPTRARQEPMEMHSSFKVDLWRMMMILTTTFILAKFFNISSVYHTIKSQSTLKTLFLYNIFDIADKMLSSITADPVQLMELILSVSYADFSSLLSKDTVLSIMVPPSQLSPKTPAQRTLPHEGHRTARRLVKSTSSLSIFGFPRLVPHTSEKVKSGADNQHSHSGPPLSQKKAITIPSDIPSSEPDQDQFDLSDLHSEIDTPPMPLSPSTSLAPIPPFKFVSASQHPRPSRTHLSGNVLAFSSVLCLCCFILHSFVSMTHLVTMLVAFHSSSTTLTSLIISSQFSEIKSNLFKRQKEDSLFQVVAGDSVELFTLFFHIALIFISTFLESTPIPPSLFGPSFLSTLSSLVVTLLSSPILANAVFFLVSETAVDMLKHSFITKLNNIPSSVYHTIRSTIFVECALNVQHGTQDNTSGVTRLFCFSPIPISAVFVVFLTSHLRLSFSPPTSSPQGQSKLVGSAESITIALAWLCLLAVKLVGSFLLLSHTYKRLTKQQPNRLPP